MIGGFSVSFFVSQLQLVGMKYGYYGWSPNGTATQFRIESKSIKEMLITDVIASSFRVTAFHCMCSCKTRYLYEGTTLYIVDYMAS